MRDGTAEPVSRDQALRHVRGQGNIHFPCSADHAQDWQLLTRLIRTLLYVMTIHTYNINTYIHTVLLYRESYPDSTGFPCVSFLGTSIDVYTVNRCMNTCGALGFFLTKK